MSWELKPEHCKAARYLLGWRVRKLAKASGLSEMTIGRFEANDGTAQPRTIRDIKRALVDAGVQTIDACTDEHAHVRCADGTVLIVKPQTE